MQRDHAGSLAFPSGIERFEKKKKKATVAATDISNYAFSQIVPFLSLPRRWLFFFKFKAVKKLGTLHFGNDSLGIPYLGFLKTKQLAHIMTGEHILVYEIVKIKADASLKMQPVAFFFSQNF